MLRSGRAGILPSAYQEVEWIGTDGHCLIDTGVIPVTAPVFETEYYLPNGTSQDGLLVCFGTSGEPDWTFNFYTRTGTIFGRYGNRNARSIGGITGYGVDSWVSISSGKEVYANGSLRYTHQSYDFTSNVKTVCLFARKNGTAGYIGRAKACTVKDGDAVRFNGIPCYRKSDNEIGLYDTVSNTFFLNAGSGTFTKGDDV